MENKEDMDEERTIFFACKSGCIKITHNVVIEVVELISDQ